MNSQIFCFSHMDSLTVSYDSTDDVNDILPRAYESFRVETQVKAATHYHEAYRLTCGAVVNMNHSGVQGCKVDFGGKALWAIREVTGWSDETILKMVGATPLKKRTTRIDYAFNICGAGKVEHLRQAIERGNYTGHLKPAPSIKTPGKTEGQTVYFGSKDSDWRIRVYDKAAEMDMLWLAWTRIEGQARGDYAQNASIDAGEGVSLADHFRARIIKSMGNVRLAWFKRAMMGEVVKVRSLVKKQSVFEARMAQIEAELMKKAELPEQRQFIAEWAANLALRLVDK